MQLKKLIKIVSSRAKSIEELEISGKKWVARLQELNIIKAGTKVLDYGAGVGRLSKAMQEAGCDVLGVDRLPDMVSYLMSQSIKAIDDQTFKEIDEKFDFAIATYVLQHMGIDKARDVIKEIGRVTDTFYFTVPELSIYKDSGMPENYMLGIESSGDEVFNECEKSFYYRNEDIDILFEGCGFLEIKKVELLKNANFFVATK